MSDNPQLPPGSPSPINITLADSFGGQKVEQIQVDSNRLGVAGERRHYWNEDLSIPARPCDIWLQAACWVGGSAFLASGMRSLPIMVQVIAPLIVIVLVAVGVSAFAWVRYQDLRLMLLYRCSLVICGICLGALL